MADRDDYHCTSSIDERYSVLREGCARFVFKIKTWFHFHPKGNTWGSSGRVFQCHDWKDDNAKNAFKNQFKKLIEQDWGNGAFWILHSQKGTKDLWCDVEIELDGVTRESADLCVNAVTGPLGRPVVLADPPGWGRFRGWSQSLSKARTYAPPAGLCGAEEDQDSEAPELNVVGNPIDMHMTEAEVMQWSKSSGDQSVLLHEFGHYMGLHHPCPSTADGSNGYCNTHPQWHQDRLMAAGNVFLYEYAQGFLSRLRSHHQDYLGLEQETWRFVAEGHSVGGGGNREQRPWRNNADILAQVEAKMREMEAKKKEEQKEIRDFPISWKL